MCSTTCILWGHWNAVMPNIDRFNGRKQIQPSSTHKMKELRARRIKSCKGNAAFRGLSPVLTYVPVCRSLRAIMAFSWAWKEQSGTTLSFEVVVKKAFKLFSFGQFTAPLNQRWDTCCLFFVPKRAATRSLHLESCSHRAFFPFCTLCFYWQISPHSHPYDASCILQSTTVAAVSRYTEISFVLRYYTLCRIEGNLAPGGQNTV